MAGKEAIPVILDVGKSMHTPSLDDPSIRRLDVALDFIKTFLTQKVPYLFTPSHSSFLGSFQQTTRAKFSSDGF